MDFYTDLISVIYLYPIHKYVHNYLVLMWNESLQLVLRCIDWVVWVIKFGARNHPFLLGAFMYSIKWDVIYLIDNQNI